MDEQVRADAERRLARLLVDRQLRRLRARGAAAAPPTSRNPGRKARRRQASSGGLAELVRLVRVEDAAIARLQAARRAGAREITTLLALQDAVMRTIHFQEDHPELDIMAAYEQIDGLARVRRPQKSMAAVNVDARYCEHCRSKGCVC